MRLRTLLRSSAATYIIPVLVVYILVAVGHDLTAFTTDNYWPSVAGSSAYARPFITAICAGLGSWEGARLSRGQIFAKPAVRGSLTITGVILAPVVLGGFLTALIALGVSARSAHVGWGMPDWRFLLAELLLITANSLTGYCIGHRWSAVLAVPAALVGAFVVNAFPASWTVLWVRHLVGGGLPDCCATDQVLSDRALGSAIAFSAGVILAGAVLVRLRASRIALPTALVLLLLGTGVGTVLAHPLGALPVQARPDSELICDKYNGLDICLWPEVRNPAMIRTETGKVVAALHKAGVPTPTGLTMSDHPFEGATKLGILPDAEAADVAPGIVSGLMPPTPKCASAGPYPAGDAYAPVAAWLLLTAGANPDSITRNIGIGASELAERVQKGSSATQRDWYTFNVRAMHSCTTKPRLSPTTGAPE